MLMEIIVAGAILLLTIIPTGPKKPQDAAPLALVASAKTIIPTPTPTTKPKEPIIHKVISGETLDSIAKDEYGSSKYWTSLWNDNDFISDPRIINAGMTLKIREDKPTEVEDLNDKLATIYQTIISPSPTPTPTPGPTQASIPSNDRSISPSGSFGDTYKQAGDRFGVPWQILYAIHMVETGQRDGAISSGYGTGAQGPMQFMPGTWAGYGIDGNGDGIVDINNAIDAIFGAANFIAKHGGVDAGLKAYGGDTQGILNIARGQGYNQ